MVATFGNTNADEFLQDSGRDFLAVLQSCRSVHSAAQASGVSPRVIAGILRSIRFLLQANDGDADDFLSLVENWNPDGIEAFLFPDRALSVDDYVREASTNSEREAANQPSDLTRKKQNVIDQIGRDWSPQEMRDLGASLMRLADALDQNWNPGALQSSFYWPSAARQIERNAIELAKKATLIKRQLNMRKNTSPKPCWWSRHGTCFLNFFANLLEAQALARRAFA